jgi:hypothetical protein
VIGVRGEGGERLIGLLALNMNDITRAIQFTSLEVDYHLAGPFGCYKMPISNLPLELLRIIVDKLWGSDLRACLNVSRAFHAHAAARLFRTVHLRFGLEGAPGVLCDRGRHTLDDYNAWLHAENVMHVQTGDMMQAIEDGGDFARAVKRIVVHAEYGRDGAVFQRREFALISYVSFDNPNNSY